MEYKINYQLLSNVDASLSISAACTKPKCRKFHAAESCEHKKHRVYLAED